MKLSTVICHGQECYRQLIVFDASIPHIGVLVVNVKVRPASTWEPTFTTHGQNTASFNMVAHERRFADSEKKEIADIICNEEMVSVNGLKKESIIGKL